MKPSLKGGFLPESEAEFKGLIEKVGSLKFFHCIGCNALFSHLNTRSPAAWRETQISGYCGDCFDEITAPPEDDDESF